MVLRAAHEGRKRYCLKEANLVRVINTSNKGSGQGSGSTQGQEICGDLKRERGERKT